ncbi:MAG TPA: hypothetical protein VFP87_05825 [Chitinophagaceae bacterium]|nr:hypothetical protein [Chitinophagaceae bacterium]
MKRNVIILLLAVATTFNLNAKTPTGDKVDPLVEAKFKKDFGSSVNVSWKIVEGIFVATFTDQGGTKDVYYYDDGELLGFGKILKRDLLPETVKSSISEKFSTGVIQTVYEFKEAGAATRYFVTVVTKTYSMIVAANEFGQVDVRQRTKNSSFVQR